MKKSFGRIVAVSLSLFALCACGNKSSNEQPVTEHVTKVIEESRVALKESPASISQIVQKESEGKIDLTELKEREYYGIFVAAYKTREECAKTEAELEKAGFTFNPVVYTPDFSKLNPEPYYAVCADLCVSKEQADKTLADIKKAGFKDAYVKAAGTYIGDTFWYMRYGNEDIEVTDDYVIFHDVNVSIPYNTYDDEALTMDIKVGQDAEFDKSANTSNFGLYNEGDTPYLWITRNYNLMQYDPDEYVIKGNALSGIFEVSFDETGVSKYYGIYWWD